MARDAERTALTAVEVKPDAMTMAMQGPRDAPGQKRISCRIGCDHVAGRPRAGKSTYSTQHSLQNSYSWVISVLLMIMAVVSRSNTVNEST